MMRQVPSQDVPYGDVMRQAWELTWRHRSLWILGLLAGGAAAPSLGGNQSMQWRESSREAAPPVPRFEGMPDEAVRWFTANAGLVAGAVALAVFLGLVLLVMSFVAQGAMARATADLAEGRVVSLGAAWRAGGRLFWRYVGLWLLLGLAAAAVGITVAVLVGLVTALAVQGSGPLAVGVGVLVGPPLFVAFTVAAIALSIIVPYAQRAIVVLDVGSIGGLRAGWQLLRVRPGPSLLFWLLNVALSLGASILGAIAMLGVAIVVGPVVLAAWALAGGSALLVGVGIAAALVLLGALLVLSAGVNTFFWHYWTQAYMRLQPQPPAAAAALTEAA